MANASRKHFGPGVQPKGSGTGGQESALEDGIEENMVLSNRDKSRHPDQRGLDNKAVQTEQWHDHDANRLSEEP